MCESSMRLTVVAEAVAEPPGIYFQVVAAGLL